MFKLAAKSPMCCCMNVLCRRQVEQENRARDVRLQRALEEVDKYKQLLQGVQLQVRGGRGLSHACRPAPTSGPHCWQGVS